MFKPTGAFKAYHAKYVPQQSRQWILVAAAGLIVLSLGLPASFFLYGTPSKAGVPVAATPTPIKLIELFKPAKRISAGTKITAPMLRMSQVPENQLSRLSDDVILEKSKVIGKYAASDLLPDTYIQSIDLVDELLNAVARRIPQGYRAVTLRVDDVTGIEGWSTPGAKVDIVWAYDVPNQESVVTTVVEGAEVLSVMGNARDEEGSLIDSADRIVNDIGRVIVSTRRKDAPLSSFTVTVLVRPRDGKKLFLASTKGRLSLMLRGDFDRSPTRGNPGNNEVLTKDLLSDKFNGPDSRVVEGSAWAKGQNGATEEWMVVDGRVGKWGDETS